MAMEPWSEPVTLQQEKGPAWQRRFSMSDWVIQLILIILGILVLLPFYDVVIVSLGNPEGAMLPTKFTLTAYTWVFTHSGLFRAFLTSVGIVVVGTALSLVLTTCTAYALSRKQLWGRQVLLGIIVFTMFFGGGLIPWYLVVKSVGLINNYLAMIIPSAMNAFYMILMLTFFRQFPTSLEESARMDGANDWSILWRIVLPTSAPVMATIGLFYSVDRWNDWFTPMIFLTDPSLWPLQTFTQNLITNASMILQTAAGMNAQSQLSLALLDPVKMAVVLVGILPILFVYPFLQKHFAKGVMIGSIKE